MKFSRQKKCKKILNYYSTHFKYKEPFQALVDGTFCQMALKNKVSIGEQLRKYLLDEIFLVTTRCVILEVERLGAKFTGAAQIVKSFVVHQCVHEKADLTGSQCILAMVKSSKYIVASQDIELQQRLRKIPGQALLYLHRNTPVLDPPSDATKKFVSNKVKMVSEQAIKNLKPASTLNAPANKVDEVKKRKRITNPNPLSCKKSKKNKNQNQQSSVTKLSNRTKKKYKVPKHLKEHLKAIVKEIKQ